MTRHCEGTMLADPFARAGFDALELHFGHHYLVSAFLPRWNRRRDDYSGPVANRTRLDHPDPLPVVS
jgi:2,4-dienoyl-CoA reductase-like NADH-dependent reductase (Old Yellow Enzyme family)